MVSIMTQQHSNTKEKPRKAAERIRFFGVARATSRDEREGQRALASRALIFVSSECSSRPSNPRFCSRKAHRWDAGVKLRRLMVAESGIEAFRRRSKKSGRGKKSRRASLSSEVARAFLEMMPLCGQNPDTPLSPSSAATPTLSPPPTDSGGHSACAKTKEKLKLDLEFTRHQKHLARREASEQRVRGGDTRCLPPFSHAVVRETL